MTVWDLDDAKLDAAKASLGASADVKRVDISNPASVEKAAAEAETAMGHIDGLRAAAPAWRD